MFDLIRYDESHAVQRRFAVKVTREGWPVIEMDVVMVQGHRGPRPELSRLEYRAGESEALPPVRKLREIPVHELLTTAVQQSLLTIVETPSGRGVKLVPARREGQQVALLRLRQRTRGSGADAKARAEGVKLFKRYKKQNRNDPASVVAKELGVHRSTVYRWVEEEG